MPELATKADLLAMKQELQRELRNIVRELQTESHKPGDTLKHTFEMLTLRLTLRLGAMFLAALTIAAIMVKRL